MKLKHIFLFSINSQVTISRDFLADSKALIVFVLLAFNLSIFSQTVKKDAIVYKDTYGLRLGLDLSNPVRSAIDSDRKSFEIVADYRIAKRYYVAAEIGYLDNLRQEDLFDFQTKGQYIKLGINYNAYQNWLDMENEIYFGFRYGFSTFSQTLNNFSINSDIALPGLTTTDSQKFDGLNANWAELIIGIKTEIYSNIYLGFSVSVKKMLFTKEPDNFKNLYVPGFDRVFLNDSGFSINYTISYRLPLYKKAKNKQKSKDKSVKKIEKTTTK
jgi:hypothetical protein